jgi:predicted nucleic acid-binding protein
MRGCHLAAPRLLRYEIENSAGKKRIHEGWKTEDLRRALDAFSRWQLKWFDLPPAQCLETAAQTGLSAYDTAYLCLARELNAELLTLDEKLAKACAK